MIIGMEGIQYGKETNGNLYHGNLPVAVWCPVYGTHLCQDGGLFIDLPSMAGYFYPLGRRDIVL